MPRPERTREPILDAANRVLLKHGYHGVGLETVAKAAGVSRQTVYDRFGSKSGLIAAMTSRAEEQAGLPRLLASVWSQPNGLAMLRAFLDTLATVEPKVYPYSRLAYAARMEDPAAAQIWHDRMQSRRMGMRRVFQKLASEGRLLPGIDADEAGEIAWAITSPHQYELLVIERKWSIDRYRSHLETTITRRLLRS